MEVRRGGPPEGGEPSVAPGANVLTRRGTRTACFSGECIPLLTPPAHPSDSFAMLDALRTTLHRVLVTPRGDAVPPLRLTKDLARRLNRTLGQPICSADELQRRRLAAARLDELARAPRRPGTPAAGAPAVAAPVKVYFEGDRNVRELTRIRELLDSRAIVYELLDVAGDEPTIVFVTREAKCEADDLPVVFVGATAVGGYAALANADLSGALTRPS